MPQHHAPVCDSVYQTWTSVWHLAAAFAAGGRQRAERRAPHAGVGRRGHAHGRRHSGHAAQVDAFVEEGSAGGGGAGGGARRRGARHRQCRGCRRRAGRGADDGWETVTRRLVLMAHYIVFLAFVSCTRHNISVGRPAKACNSTAAKGPWGWSTATPLHTTGTRRPGERGSAEAFISKDALFVHSLRAATCCSSHRSQVSLVDHQYSAPPSGLVRDHQITPTLIITVVLRCTSCSPLQDLNSNAF